MTTFSFPLSDQLSIHAQQWEPVGTPRAVILLVHGLGEHINRYDHWARRLNQKGYVVVGSDHRGHGKSDGKRGHIDRYELYLEEIDKLRDLIAKQYPQLPVVLYGHSLGGNIALNYVLDRGGEGIAKVVVTSPYIRTPQPEPAIKLQVGKLLRMIAPKFTLPNDLPADKVATDPEIVQRYQTDPLVHDRISAAGGLAIVEAARRLDNFNGTFPVPLLLMHAGDDHLTGTTGTIAFKERVDGAVDLKIWEGMYHEIHNDLRRGEVFDFLIEWLDK